MKRKSLELPNMSSGFLLKKPRTEKISSGFFIGKNLELPNMSSGFFVW